MRNCGEAYVRLFACEFVPVWLLSLGVFEDCWGEDDAYGQFLIWGQQIMILREIPTAMATPDRLWGTFVPRRMAIPHRAHSSFDLLNTVPTAA